MQSEPSLKDLDSTVTYERKHVAEFMRAAETYHALFGKPKVFCVNKEIFTKVVGWFIQNQALPVFGDDELPKINMWGVTIDSSDLNPPNYLVGIHDDASIKRVGMNVNG